MRRCMEEVVPMACSPLPADAIFRALFNGEICMHHCVAPHMHIGQEVLESIVHMVWQAAWHFPNLFNSRADMMGHISA